MSGYRRFVAYVYEYQKGKKGRNCGFIQVEAKEQTCRMEAHILCPGLTPHVKCEIFGFVRRMGRMDGVLLGACMTEDSRADCVLETARNHMGGSGTSLEDMGGMILLTENGAFFGTEWDDKPIRPENFRRVEIEKPENKITEKETKPESSTTDRELSEAEASEEIKAEDENVFFESRIGEEIQRTLSEDNNSGQEMHHPENGAEETQDSQPEEKNAHLQEKDLETSIGEGQQETAAEGYSQKPESETGMHTPEKPETEYLTSQSVASCNQKISELNDQALSFGDPTDAFCDGEICDCRRIQPTDLCHFRPGDCALRNNRFLQYGFYNFGHLLIGKNSSGHYILGVPGGYDQQERFMANMFGFPYFKESRQIQLPKSRGGYWYRLINPPKLD